MNNIVRAFQLTALMALAPMVGAFAQQKPKKDDAKPKTEFTPIKSDSTYDHKVDKLGRKIWEQWVKDEETEKKTLSGTKTEVPATNLPALPGEKKVDPLLTPQQMFDERQDKMTEAEKKAEADLMKDPKKLAEMRAGLRKKLAKAEAEHNKEEIAALKARNDELEEYIALVLQDNQMLREQLKTTTDSLRSVENRKQLTVVTNNYIYSDSSQVKTAPWEVSTGPTRLWLAGPKFDPNRDQLGPIDDHYNIVQPQTPVNGWFFDARKHFAGQGFGSVFAFEAYLALFNGDELPELVSIGDTDNSGLYEYTIDAGKLLTYGQASLNIGKEFRAGMFGFEPALNLGVHYQDVPEFKMKDPAVKVDRWTNQAMEANRFSAFAEASFKVAFYLWEQEKLIKADEEKKAKKKNAPDKIRTQALGIYLSGNIFDTTQKPVQANPYSGVGPFNGEDQYFWHVDLGLVYKF